MYFKTTTQSGRDKWVRLDSVSDFYQELFKLMSLVGLVEVKKLVK